MNISESDIRMVEKDLFISFRTTLKALLQNEYYDIFSDVCDEPLSRNIMLSIKNYTVFNGEVVKHSRSLNPTKCGILIANTVFTMFQILCSLQTEYNVKSHIRKLAGVISDAGRGISAMERVVFAVNVIYYVSSKHYIFDLVQDSINEIENYLNIAFGCDIETID